MANTSTYTINFEANLSDLKRLQTELDNIKNNSNIKLTVDAKNSLALLQTQLSTLVQTIQSKLQDGKIESGDLLGFKRQFNDLLKLTDTFKGQLLDLSISPEAAEQIHKITEEIQKAQAELSVLRQDRLSHKKGFKVEEGKVTGTTVGTRNQAFLDIKGTESLSGPDASVISTYQQLANVIEKLKKQLGDDFSTWTGEAAHLSEIWTATNERLTHDMQVAQTLLDQDVRAIQSKQEEIKQLRTSLKEAENAGIATSDLSEELRTQLQAVQDVSSAFEFGYKKALEDVKQKQKEVANATKTATTEIQTNNKTTQTSNITLQKANTTLGRAVQNVLSYGTAIQLVRRIYQNFIRTITELDKALTNMTVVTNLTRDQAWALTGTLQDLAKQTGMTSTEIANMTTMYLQQGKTLKDALTLTEAAAKAARIAGISGEESINLLTNAMNGFQLAADQAMEVSDKFAALAASAATDYEELATALSKVAAQANLAGLSMDFTLGLLTKGIETTREAPETIGTALKTVLSRMRELTDYGKTLEDGLDVNRVDKALQNVGISLMDTNGQFRDMESVLTDVGMKWDQLNTNQQANIAVALAGTRQQSRLIAMFQDFDRTLELTNIAMTSAGATAAQHRKYMQGLEAATSRLTTSYQEFVTALTNSDIAISIINKISSLLGAMADHIGIVYAALGTLLAVFVPLIAQKALDVITTSAATAWELLHAKAIREATKAELQQQLVIVQNKQAELDNIAAKKQAIAAEDAQTLSQLRYRIIALKTIIARHQDSLAIKQNTLAKAKDTLATLENNEANGQAINIKQKLKLQAQIANAQAEISAEKNQLLIAQNKLIKTQDEERVANIKSINSALEAQNATNEAAANKLDILNIQSRLANVITLAGAGASIKAAIAKKLEEKGIEKVTIAKLLHLNVAKADATATAVETAAVEGETVAVEGATAAQHGFNAALLANPITWIVIAIVALIAAWWSLNKETEHAKMLLDALKESFSAIFGILKAILDLLKPSFDFIMMIVDFIMGEVMTALKILAAVLKVIEVVVTAVSKAIMGFLNLITGGILGKIADGIGWLWDKIGEGLDWFTNLMDSWLDALDYAFASASERIEMLAEDIAENEEKIYDKQQYVSSLQPLIDEYEQLSKVANKSADDLARMEEIRSQVKDIDENIDLSKGSAGIQQARDAIAAAENEANALIEENYQKAVQGFEEAEGAKDSEEAFETYNNSPEMKRAISTAIAKDINANADLDDNAKRNIIERVDTIVTAHTFDEDDDIDKYREELGKAVTEIYTFPEEGIEAQIENYRKVKDEYKDVADDLATGFAELEEVSKLNLDKTGYAAMDRLGLTVDEVSQLRDSFIAAGGTAEDFEAQLAGALETNDPDKLAEAFMHIGDNIPTDKMQEFKNQLLSLGGITVQSTLETLTRTTSWTANLAESAAKFASGELTPEEFRSLAAENADLFKDQSFVNAFTSGDLSKWQEEQDRQAEEKAKADIAFRNQQLQVEIDRLSAAGNLSQEEQAILDDYQAQINANNVLMDQIHYKALWANEEYQAAKALTAEQKEQLRVRSKISKLEQLISDSEEPNFGLYRELLTQYEADINSNRSIYNKSIKGQSAMDAFEVLADGTLQLNAAAFASIYDTNRELYDYINENMDAIKDAYKENYEYEQTILDTLNEIQDAAVDAAKEQLELEKEQLEKRKDLYEDYWDKLDALDEEEERQQNRDSILSQLQALTGGADAATNAKRKELLQSLEDLNEEEQEAQKQAMRDAITQDIDDTINSIDEKIDSLENLGKIVQVGTNVQSILEAVAKQSGVPVESLGISNVSAVDWSGGNQTTSGLSFKYKQGGLVDYTGPAWVDGSLSDPEAFLSAADTKLMRALLDVLHIAVGDVGNETDISTDNIVIENINIHTDQLNNEQDFGRAGRSLADEFARAIQRRGININVKR